MGYTHALEIESPSTPWWVSRRKETARFFFGVLLAALCLDYGGGIGIKYVGIFVALGWIASRRSSAAILARRWKDFAVLIAIPTLIAVFHLIRALMFNPDFQATSYAIRYYNTLSTPALLLLFPLIYFAGTKASLRQISVAFRCVSVFLILLFIMHASGLINLADYWDLAQRYQLGMLGIDPRIEGRDVAQAGQYSLRIGFSMPLIFGYELATSAVGSVLMLIGFLIVGSRGLILGAFLVAGIWFLRPGSKRKAGWRMAFAAGLAVSLLLASAPLRFRLTEVFLHRSAGIFAGSDFTTLIRLGHLRGYYSMVATDPWKLFLGDGPTGHIDNPVWRALLGYGEVSVTELSILNVALYYGLPYALLFAVWLFRSVWQLWKLRYHPRFTNADMGLLIGATIFWITGNINPQMLAPFSMIAFMLLSVRRDELTLDEAARPAP